MSNIKPEIFDVKDRTTAINFLISSIHTIEGFNWESPLEVILTVNGKQLPFKDAIEDWNSRIYQKFNETVEERAKELVKIRTTDKIDEISEVLSKVKESILHSLRDEGFKNMFDDSDYWHEE